MDLILDYGAALISVEIKAGCTISSDYFKGIQQYRQISGTKNTKRIIIYTGEKTVQYRDTEVYSYLDLPRLFDDLNKQYP